jgi:hypothetical protein
MPPAQLLHAVRCGDREDHSLLLLLAARIGKHASGGGGLQVQVITQEQGQDVLQHALDLREGDRQSLPGMEQAEFSW